MNKDYLKAKMKGIGGAATLQPPQGNPPGLQSVASMSVLDLISEGPIYGLVDGKGRKTNGISILESVYLDDTPVVSKNTTSPQISNISNDEVQLIHQLTSLSHL